MSTYTTNQPVIVTIAGPASNVAPKEYEGTYFLTTVSGRIAVRGIDFEGGIITVSASCVRAA